MSDYELSRTAGESTNQPAMSEPMENLHEQQARTRCQDRMKRALDCVDRALEEDDPFAASLGSMTGNLLMFNAQLDEAIQSNLGHGQPTLEQIQKLSSSVELNLKVARQIDRQFHLMNREGEKTRHK